MKAIDIKKKLENLATYEEEGKVMLKGRIRMYTDGEVTFFTGHTNYKEMSQSLLDLNPIEIKFLNNNTYLTYKGELP